ncbi:hypothetical protein BDV40DRAFT_172384 [Aspergillus tamarii]|uniref:Uncharacterized protein n=1 Tax=Aspergillus tamarii TaxID=41984 RepID=A0A5N6UTG9_ASPTM|nr:hypothetical protein BDV40DRAFT_172384 [Aspergillus tamarii]
MESSPHTHLPQNFEAFSAPWNLSRGISILCQHNSHISHTAQPQWEETLLSIIIILLLVIERHQHIISSLLWVPASFELG